jgi:hypothetical protein
MWRGHELSLGDIFLCETGMTTNGDKETHDEDTKATIRVVTNKEHPIRPFCTNPSKNDELVLQPITSKFLFVRAAEHLGTLQIDMRRIEITPQYNRTPLTTIDHQQHDCELCAIVRGYKNQRFRVETNRILKKKIYTDGSKNEEEEGYAVVWEEQTIKRKIHLQNSIYRAEQLAIINTIYSTRKKRTEGDNHGLVEYNPISPLLALFLKIQIFVLLRPVSEVSRKLNCQKNVFKMFTFLVCLLSGKRTNIRLKFW